MPWCRTLQHESWFPRTTGYSFLTWLLHSSPRSKMRRLQKDSNAKVPPRLLPKSVPTLAKLRWPQSGIMYPMQSPQTLTNLTRRPRFRTHLRSHPRRFLKNSYVLNMSVQLLLRTMISTWTIWQFPNRWTRRRIQWVVVIWSTVMLPSKAFIEVHHAMSESTVRHHNVTGMWHGACSLNWSLCNLCEACELNCQDMTRRSFDNIRFYCTWSCHQNMYMGLLFQLRQYSLTYQNLKLERLAWIKAGFEWQFFPDSKQSSANLLDSDTQNIQSQDRHEITRHLWCWSSCVRICRQRSFARQVIGSSRRLWRQFSHATENWLEGLDTKSADWGSLKLSVVFENESSEHAWRYVS